MPDNLCKKGAGKPGQIPKKVHIRAHIGAHIRAHIGVHIRAHIGAPIRAHSERTFEKMERTLAIVRSLIILNVFICYRMLTHPINS